MDSHIETWLHNSIHQKTHNGPPPEVWAELERLQSEYTKAAASYGGICKTLEESGKANAKLEAENERLREKVSVVPHLEESVDKLIATRNKLQAEVERLREALKDCTCI
jgi:regulator of replication initiation timing